MRNNPPKTSKQNPKTENFESVESHLGQSISSASALTVTDEARKLIVEECDSQGVTLKYLVGKIKECCEARKIIQDKYGTIVAEEPEHATVLKATLAGLEVRGELKPGKDAGGITNNNIYNVKALIQQVKNIK